MSPATVALIRGTILAIVGSVIGVIVNAANNLPGDLSDKWWVPFLLLAIREGEGAWDQFVAKQPKQKPGGGGDADAGPQI